MGEWLTFTFALTGRRNGEHGTRGVAPGYDLTGLSARTGPQIGLWHRGAVASLPTLIFQDFEHPTFQGAPFRALFVYHVRMLRHFLFGSKPRRDFSVF